MPWLGNRWLGTKEVAGWWFLVRADLVSGLAELGVLVWVVMAVRYGYFWWKGWKLPDMMFATRRSLADAGKSFSKQIDSVFSIDFGKFSFFSCCILETRSNLNFFRVTKRQLSSNLDGVDRNLAESLETTVRTQQESTLSDTNELLNFMFWFVSLTFQAICSIFMDMKSKTDVFSLSQETKINRIEGKQVTPHEVLKASTRATLSITLKIVFICDLPHDLESEPCRLGSLGIQENNGISEVFEPSALESPNNGASSSGRFGFKYPTSNTSTILRTRSATIGLLQQNRSASKQF
ncbi:hypothetical protein M0R45_008954 [Rubus argutus]|uniref:DUF1664 domain-containing protein n=1 Tax=Rubus argutus TaxID=59490 RepID=A0AAW1Y355_RUBAR